MIKRIVTTIVLVLLGTTGAAAQRGGMVRGQAPDSVPSMGMTRGMMMGSGMMSMMGQGTGMMATGGPGPMMLLLMRDDLELTDEQVRRLEELQESFQNETQSHMTAMMSAHQEAAQTLQGETPDLDAYQQNLQAAANIMVQLPVAMARAAAEGRQVLTPEQLERLQAQGPQMMRGMMGRYGWGDMMPNGPR